MKTIQTLIVFCVFSFTLKAQVSFKLSSSPVVGNGPNSIASADVNGDGKMDLISAYGYDTYVNVWTNYGSGAFGLSSMIAAGYVADFTTADVNGDGKVDLILNEVNNNDLIITTVRFRNPVNTDDFV